MDENYICYCGLYCENCATMAKVAPAAKVLYNEMKAAGFEEVIQFIPGGEGFWRFLKDMAENGVCISCREGSGNPDCDIRLCAKEKGIEMCATCETYPCEHFSWLLSGYPNLESDNALLREQGLAAWAELQDRRRLEGYTYSDDKV